jgi:hypothetical protein
MAGFEVITYGRFWVIAEETQQLLRQALISRRSRHYAMTSP